MADNPSVTIELLQKDLKILARRLRQLSGPIKAFANLWMLRMMALAHHVIRFHHAIHRLLA